MKTLITVLKSTPGTLLWSVGELEVADAPDVVPLHDGGFEVRVTWTDFAGATGSDRSMPTV